MPPPMEPLIVTTADLKGKKQVSNVKCHNFILNAMVVIFIGLKSILQIIVEK